MKYACPSSAIPRFVAFVRAIEGYAARLRYAQTRQGGIHIVQDVRRN